MIESPPDTTDPREASPDPSGWGESESPVASSAWEPYDVWCTRVLLPRRLAERDEGGAVGARTRMDAAGTASGDRGS